MSSATVTVQSEPAAPSLSTLRDELMQAHHPADAYERMLVTQIAQSWLRLQRAEEAEERYCATRDMVEVLTTKLKEFQAVTRWVTDCERAWRHAVTLLKAAQRRRERETKASPARRAPQPKNTAAPTPAPLVASMPSPVTAARRE